MRLVFNLVGALCGCVSCFVNTFLGAVLDLAARLLCRSSRSVRCVFGVLFDSAVSLLCDGASERAKATTIANKNFNFIDSPRCIGFTR